MGERDLVIEIEVEATEGVRAVAWCEELLKLEDVIQADSAAEERWDQSDSF